MLRLIFLIFFSLVLNVLEAQMPVTGSDAPKKALKLLQKAEKCIQKGEEEEAIEKLKKSIEIEPLYLDAHLKLASIYYNSEQYVSAAEQYAKAFSLDSSKYKIAQSAALSYEKGSDFDMAILYFQKTLDLQQRQKPEIASSARDKIKLLKFRKDAISKPVKFDPIVLPNSINDPIKSEYSPSLTADGKTLFFTRLVSGQEDIYYSEKDSLGAWTLAKKLPNLNTLENEGGHNISADGKVILFTYCSNSSRSNIRGCNIYVSFKRGGIWSKPQYFEAINSSAWDSQANISSDGNIIIFTSLRKGGSGKSDLWWTKKNSDGKWTIPENLGPRINTSLREESPFFHPDGKTLYFKSEGHAGMGSFDLFRATLEEDGSWTEPQNLGYPINTEDHEGSMIVSLDGSTALFSRGNGKMSFDRTQTDLFSFELPEEHKASPVGFANIRVFDAESRLPISADIRLQSEGNLVKDFTTDSESSKLITLPLGSNYNIIVEKEGYYFYSDRFELVKLNSAKTAFEIDVYLSPVQVTEVPENKPIILKNILFESASFEFKQESYFELDQLRKLLEENDGIKIEISGHTDDIGDDDANQVLSENRAKAVYDYLIINGISKDRLTFVGYGEMRPIASNESEEGRAMNRRTEFIRRQ